MQQQSPATTGCSEHTSARGLGLDPVQGAVEPPRRATGTDDLVGHRPGEPLLAIADSMVAVGVTSTAVMTPSLRVTSTMMFETWPPPCMQPIARRSRTRQHGGRRQAGDADQRRAEDRPARSHGLLGDRGCISSGRDAQLEMKRSASAAALSGSAE